MSIHDKIIITDVQDLASIFPGIDISRFRKYSGGRRYQGPCPWCGGKDRFRIWEHAGTWWARCQQGTHFHTRSGARDTINLDYYTGRNVHLTRQQLDEIRRAESERQERERQERQGKILELTASRVWEEFYSNIWQRKDVLNSLADDGIGPDLIERFIIGFNPKFKAIDDDEKYRYFEAITFPHFRWTTINGVGGWYCTNIRHRLLGATKSKYRPIISGLGIDFFRAIQMDKPTPALVIVEGEKKSIVVYKQGLSAIGFWGVDVFSANWLDEIEDYCLPVVVIYDNEPNNINIAKAAMRAAMTFNATIAVPPVEGKLDDLILAGRIDIHGLVAEAIIKPKPGDIIIE